MRDGLLTATMNIRDDQCRVPWCTGPIRPDYIGRYVFGSHLTVSNLEKLNIVASPFGVDSTSGQPQFGDGAKKKEDRKENFTSAKAAKETYEADKRINELEDFLDS